MDFPLTTEQFLDVFGSYNLSVWPSQVFIIILTFFNYPEIVYDFWPVQSIITMRTPIIRQFAMTTLDLGVFKIIVRRGVYNKERVNDELMELFRKPMLTQEGRKGFLHFA